MIFDSIKNAQNYFNLSDSIKLGLEFLISQNLETLPIGRHEILEDKVFALVQEYETKQETIFEVHKRFIDIQYVVSGKERLGFCDISHCRDSKGYDAERDLEFFNSCAAPIFIPFRKDTFVIFYPTDAHAPSLAFGAPEQVKKIVVKVAI